MTLHETCTQSNNIAINNPVEGAASLRKVLQGTFTRTCVTTNCGGGGGGGGSGSCYGAGGSGSGVLIKDMTAADGGTSMRPEQQIMVFMGQEG
jgi:hypothetical protein